MWTDERRGHDASTQLGELARGVRQAAAGEALLVVPAEHRTIHGWISVSADLDLTALMRALEPGLLAAGARLAFGEPGVDVSGFRVSHGQACEAQRMTQLSGLGTCVRYDDVSVIAIATHNLPEVRRFIQRELGALTADNDATRRLVTTARVFLDHRMSYRAASGPLHVHQNTVNYRIRRAGELLGRPVASGGLRLHLALVLQEALHSSAGHGDLGDEAAHRRRGRHAGADG